MARNEQVNEFIRSYASQGLTVGQIKAELKAKRMKAPPNSRIAYYVGLARKEGKTTRGERAVKLTKGADFQRALKVLEADVLTADEKVSIALMILKAKPTA